MSYEVGKSMKATLDHAVDKQNEGKTGAIDVVSFLLSLFLLPSLPPPNKKKQELGFNT